METDEKGSQDRVPAPRDGPPRGTQAVGGDGAAPGGSASLPPQGGWTPPEPGRIGQDELNLTEFPIALLADRAPRGKPMTRRFTSGDKIWEILGHVDYGLPTRPDMEVYVVLTELTREQGFPEQVLFSRHDLLQRLGWGTDARRYARLQQAFDCWVGVTIRTTNAFYDKSTGEWLSRHAFHLLEEYQIHERRRRHPLRGDPVADERTRFPSWFRWSDTIRRNMAARYLKPLDVELFLTFRSAVTQALYRYLDTKRLNGKPSFQQNILDLGKQHLGLPGHYYPSQIKRELDQAHQELIAAGFLTGAHYEPMRGDGGEKVVYQFAPKRPYGLRIADCGLRISDKVKGSPSLTLSLNPQSAIRNPQSTDPLLQQLVDLGVTRRKAEELVVQDREECERQLLYLPHRQVRNRAAALVKAISGAWAPPPACLEAQAVREALARAEAQQQRAAATEAQAAADAAAFDAWWAALPAREREPLAARAQAELLGDNPILAQHYQRHPDRQHAALRPLLMRLSGWRG